MTKEQMVQTMANAAGITKKQAATALDAFCTAVGEAMRNGDKLTITACPKGGGSENMSALGMLTPSQGREGIKKFIVDTISKAGSNPCPPVIVGCAAGGTNEEVTLLAKKALCRTVGEPNPDPEVASLEQEIQEEINKLGIGAQGFGGTKTALAVHMLTHPVHLASLPVAVNVQCHVARHKTVVL